MTFAGINALAILIAAVVGWLSGAVWYSALGKLWVEAQGKTMEEFHAHRAAIKGTPAAWLPFALAFVADLVMAWVLAGLVGHMGSVTIRSAVISALFAWAGFVLTTIVVNYSFGGRRYRLAAIDAGHWLIVLVLMGVVIGWVGV
ncbi:MAG: hypothetical protein QOF14_4368 [Hyphomicrobiales bacterium]|jgi:hypothetical protein|nr:hypothetical protein [Hyphomicrobiales bacterium]